MLTRTALAGWVATAALGLFVLATVLPPTGGPVPGLTRSLDTDLGFLLWPWRWFSADPRLILMAPFVLAGLMVWRRPGWLSAAVLLPLVVEAVQYLAPGLSQVAAARDVVHAWIGLGSGVLLGVIVAGLTRLVHWAVRGSSARRRVLVPVGVMTLALLVAPAVWPSGETRAVADPADAQGPLLGQDFHGGAAPDREDAAWIAAGTVPGAGTVHEGMAGIALWDLRVLTDGLADGRLPVAGPAPQWQYFWPRDGAFVAVALARTGHAVDSALLLDQLGDLYLDPLYGFDARYLPDGGRVVDHPRGAQVDGCGWVLWAITETRRHTDLSAGVDNLRDRCTDQLLRATGGGSRLAAPSPDYWERATYERLLGANAPVLLGLRSAAADYRATSASESSDRAEVVGRSEDTGRADRLEAAAETFRSELAEHFGPDFTRTGQGGGLDAATAMLMPPFDADPLPGVREAWLGYQQGATRPGGGLAPGTDWKQDGVSWTPEVALVAYAAAADGQTDLATHWLDWLDAHRAPWGSLPEKVGPDGTPGGPAPLGWTSALVLLTLSELES